MKSGSMKLSKDKAGFTLRPDRAFVGNLLRLPSVVGDFVVPYFRPCEGERCVEKIRAQSNDEGERALLRYQWSLCRIGGLADQLKSKQQPTCSDIYTNPDEGPGKHKLYVLEKGLQGLRMPDFRHQSAVRFLRHIGKSERAGPSHYIRQF